MSVVYIARRVARNEFSGNQFPVTLSRAQSAPSDYFRHSDLMSRNPETPRVACVIAGDAKKKSPTSYREIKEA